MAMTFVIVKTIDYCIDCFPVIFRYFHTFVILKTIDYYIDCSPVIFRYFHSDGDDVCDRDNIRACVYLQTGT